MANKYKYKYPTLSSPTAHSSAQGQEASVTEDSINDPEFVSFVSLSYNLKFDSTQYFSQTNKNKEFGQLSRLETSATKLEISKSVTLSQLMC